MVCMWKRKDLLDCMPPEGERVLVSDGEIITIARYVKSDNHINWFFDLVKIEVDWWQELPPRPKKIQPYGQEIPTDRNPDQQTTEPSCNA